MRKILAFIMLALMLGSCASFPVAPLNMAKLTVFERMANSVVVLPGCTGIVLRNDGQNIVVLTAAHCVRRFRIQPPAASTAAPPVQDSYLPVPVGADLNGKETVCIGVVGSVSSARDLAIITAAKCKLPTAVAVLAKSAPKLGETVYAVGHPAASNYVLTKGIVSRPLTLFNETRYMLISAPIIFGNSGGPAFNARGEVVGVNTDVAATRVRMDDGRPFPLWAAISHLGLAVPLDDVKQFLRVARFPELAR
jgi:hypothetical protein